MAADMKLETYTDKKGQRRWRFIAANHKQIARSSRGYASQDDLIMDLVFIVDKDHDADVYTDSRGEWRWRFKKDGRVIAISSEGYKRRIDCKTASDLLLDAKLV